MEKTAATPSPVRLLVSSTAEAAKIREYATAWIAFERSVERFQKTKRWKVVQRRTTDVVQSMVDREYDCLRTWFAWQTVRAFRGCEDMIIKTPARRRPGVSSTLAL